MQPGSSGTSATKAASSSLQKMMISYLFSKSALPKVVPKNQGANLLHLVRFCFRAIALQVDLFVNSRFSENVMTSTGSLDETQRDQ